MPSYNKKDIIFVLFLSIIASLLTLFPAGLFTIICQGLTVAIIGYTVTRYHYSFVTVICFINFIINLIFIGNILYAVASSVPLILCGLTLGICYNLKFSVFKLLTIFTAVYVLNITLNIKITEIVQKGQNVFNEAIYLAGKLYREALTSAYGSEIASSEIDALVSEITSTLLRFSPSFIVIACVCFSLLSYYLFRRLNQLKKNDVSHFLKFSLWKSDKSIAVTFLILTAVTLIVPSDIFLSDVLLNMVTVMAFVYFIFGLSFMEFKLENKVNKSFLRKFILLVIAFLSLLFTGIPFIGISLLGAIDGISDFRNKKSINR